jgi:hypothetical protein
MRRLSVLVILVTIGATIWAQQSEQKLVYAFIGVDTATDSIGRSQLRVLENRLTGHLVEVAETGGYSVVIPRNRAQILDEVEALFDEQGAAFPDLARLVSAHAMVAGEINVVNDIWYMDLQAIRTESAETVATSSAQYGSFEELLNRSAEVVYALFDMPYVATSREEEIERFAAPSLPSPPPADPSADVTVGMVTGRWIGDQGIDTVRINRDGSATAELGGGNTMRLKVYTEDGRFHVRQDEPNAPRMYMATFPYSIAVQIVELARPMSWVFALSEDGERLSGVKETSFIFVEKGRVVRVDNTYVREAVWIRD